jgi:ACS family hexuronate transporter-like MFS transporter
VAATQTINARMTRHRWAVCALLFFATTINYVDRQIIGILKPTLSAEFGWSETDYADIVFAFQAAYALGLLLIGRVIDKIGVKWGYALAVGFWSLAGMAHAGASSVAGFAAARFGLGLAEAGNFPAAIKATAEWFPKKERALATGIFNSGSNVGAIITPLSVPIIVETMGWQWAFIIAGGLGFIWLGFWLWLYQPIETHPKVSDTERAHILSDPAEPEVKIPWLKLVRYRQTWAFAVGKFMTDPIWWFFLFWLPDFFGKNYGLDLKTFGIPLVIIYLLADVGSIGGGWLSSALIKRGWSVNKGRKMAMLVCALCVLPVSLAVYAENLAIAIAIIGLAAAAHQGWSANLFTLASDVMPKYAVGSVVGFGGMMGAIGGMLMSKYVGGVLENVGSYTPIFVAIGSIYLIALLIVHLLAPNLEPAKIEA